MIFPTEKHLHEFNQDRFEYKDLSKKILDEVILKMELPNCFGLFGNWGSGKSTLIHFIRQHLQDGEEVKCKAIHAIYFEPWKYEYSDQKDLLFALLNCIRKSFKDDGNKWKEILVDGLVIASGLLRFSNIDARAVADDFNLFEEKMFKDYEKWVDKIEEFGSTFQQIISVGLASEGKEKLVIFIDDLDRCLPENAVKLLECIKNFLSTENTLFILAIDRRVVGEMIEKKYGLHQGYGSEYLMKIIPYSYELPKIELTAIVEEIFVSYSVSLTDRQRAYISTFLQSFSKEPRLAKHLLRQFCMTIYLSNRLTEEIHKDTQEKKLQYLFVGFYLISKFPKLFSHVDPKEQLERLSNIRDGASQKRNNSPEKYTQIIEKDNFITSQDRRQLEAIIQYGINNGKESSPEEIIDASTLSNSMNMLKRG